MSEYLWPSFYFPVFIFFHLRLTNHSAGKHTVLFGLAIVWNHQARTFGVNFHIAFQFLESLNKHPCSPRSIRLPSSYLTPHANSPSSRPVGQLINNLSHSRVSILFLFFSLSGRGWPKGAGAGWIDRGGKSI